MKKGGQVQMIIVSQDKEDIINFNNCISLSIKIEEFKDNAGYMILATTNSYQGCIAIYKSKERAKEVLHEITKNYESKLLINFKGLLNNEHEKDIMKKYNSLSENTSVLVSDDRKDFQYIPCQKNVYYMPEE